jgi:hypothetical protein
MSEYKETNNYKGWINKLDEYCKEIINEEKVMDAVEFNNYLQYIMAQQLHSEGRIRDANDIKLANPQNPFLKFYSNQKDD